MITPYPHQVEVAAQAAEILKKHMIVYLAMEERTGKTITSILVAEQINVARVLVITKKKPLDDWRQVLTDLPHTKMFEVTNYHQASKKAKLYDLIILDESHNYISSYPKSGKLWKDVARLTQGVPLIYISATPYAQGPQQLFHQFALSSWSPWSQYKNFYNWFAKYGKPYTLPINGINVPQYDKVHQELILKDVDHLFISKTRTDLGFVHEPQDVIWYIDLDLITKTVYNELLEQEIITLSCGLLVADSASKLRTSLHQLEGGTIKIDDNRFVLANREKVDFILNKFGDVESLVIMYNFIAERQKLEAVFKKATILQATSNAEGVDLHKYSDLVIYSQDYSTARHTQRRARQANLKRDKPINVHFLLVKKAISEQVYKTVSVNKKNYVDSVFTRRSL
jgi:hypothetical protein